MLGSIHILDWMLKGCSFEFSLPVRRVVGLNSSLLQRWALCGLFPRSCDGWEFLRQFLPQQVQAIFFTVETGQTPTPYLVDFTLPHFPKWLAHFLLGGRINKFKAGGSTGFWPACFPRHLSCRQTLSELLRCLTELIRIPSRLILQLCPATMLSPKFISCHGFNHLLFMYSSATFLLFFPGVIYIINPALW